MTVNRYLVGVFVLSVTVNILSALMFLGRAHWPKRSKLFGNLAIVMGIPALAIAIMGATGGLSLGYWLMPSIYVAFCILALFLDIIYKVEFRRPRRPEILVPFLLLYFVSLMGMWGMLWNLGIWQWAISGVTYFFMLGSSAYAGRKDVG